MTAKILLDEALVATGKDWAATEKISVGRFETKAIVFVTASGRARTTDDVVGAAGILVSIIEDTHDVTVRDDSFDAQSLIHIFRAAASRVIVLPRGEQLVIHGRVDSQGAKPPFYKESSLRLELVAIAAE